MGFTIQIANPIITYFKHHLTIQNLSILFENFAKRECQSISPLYYELSLNISQDPELLSLASHSQKRQPIPNLFLAAVHFLLLKSKNEELSQFYPSISKQSSERIPLRLFKKFCVENKQAIISILKNRIVQTNAINRTAYLMPIFSSLFQNAEPITIIDIGASSGMNMNFDLYQYDYGNGLTFGKSNVRIKSELKAGTLPSFNEIASIKRKIGIEQNPLNIRNEDNALWLKALIWPDQTDRFERMEAAIQLSQKADFELVKANSIEDFKTIIEAIPASDPLVIYHTHVLYQFTKEERTEFRKLLDQIGQNRDFQYLAVEGATIFDRDWEEKGVIIELISYFAREKHSNILATTNGHANWIRWRSREG